MSDSSQTPEQPSACDFEAHKLLLKLSVTLCADRKAVDPVVQSVMNVVREMKCASGREDDIELALTEALANAVIHGANADPLFWAWAGVWLSPEFRSWNIEEHLSAIVCPVLIIQGEDDGDGTPAFLRTDSATRTSGGVSKYASSFNGFPAPGRSSNSPRSMASWIICSTSSSTNASIYPACWAGSSSCT